MKLTLIPVDYSPVRLIKVAIGPFRPGIAYNQTVAQLLFHLLKSPYDELRNTQAARKTEIGKLDSLVLQQSQSIDQLKKWNKMAMRTFAGIRNDWQKKITQTGDNK